MRTNTHWHSLHKHTKLEWSLPWEKQMRNREYLMELKIDNLLFPYREEAGLAGLLNYTVSPDAHGGWDSPLSQIRGTFTGHFLSAAANIYAETGDKELKLKADTIVEEIKKCQEANGGGWLFPIPEKYLIKLKQGGRFWAPHYVCHKVLMGLFDMHKFAENEHALDMISEAADWFVEYTKDVTRENMNHMMDVEETGGLMEIWAELYGETNDEKYKILMGKYERPSLMNPLIEGKDVTTNMHANAQIPEVHGMARAYEVTGDEKYKKAVTEFWKQTVTDRGQFATGSQTCGEVWTPADRQLSRLGETNQEHCVVYNMIRLADYLFRWTGEAVYADYIERNIYNGLFAQGFYKGRAQDSLAEHQAEEGLISYYLPLASGSQKKWGTKTNDFWCCHCTLVQANAIYRKFMMYQSSENDEVKVALYFPFKGQATIGGQVASLKLEILDDGGEIIKINEKALNENKRPDNFSVKLKITSESPVTGTFAFRIPWWAKGDVKVHCTADIKTSIADGFMKVTGTFENNTQIFVDIPRGITRWPLSDAPEYNAFLDGPVLLAGLTKKERTLYEKEGKELLVPREERKWSTWGNQYQTVGQPINFELKPLYEIGREAYTVYFPIEEKK